MKKIILFLLLAFGVSNAQIPANTKMYVFAPSGLSLRTAPSSSAHKVTVIPYGSFVNFLESTEEYISVKETAGFEISDEWVKIQYDDHIGYVFKGYLSNIKPPTKHLRENSLDNSDIQYLNETFGGQPRKDAISNFGYECEGQDCVCGYSYYYENGVSYSQESCNEISTEVTIVIPNASLGFGYHLLRGLFPDTKELLQKFDPENRIYHIYADGAGCDYHIQTKGNVLIIHYHCSC